MAYNIVDEYMNLIKKQLTQYAKTVAENLYDKSICDEYAKIYINERYCNIEGKYSIKETMEKIETKKEELINLFPKKKEKIENISIIYKDIISIDNIKEKEEIIEKISKPEISQVLAKQIEESIKEKNEFLKKYSSEEFSLKFRNIKENLNTTRIIYDIKFPMIYSNFAIDKAFNTGNIRQNRMLVEYNLLAKQILEDIINKKSEKYYIVEFEETILKKAQKQKRLFNIINNDVIKEKLIIKMNYIAFDKAKEKIYELIKQGYKIAINLDNSFKPSLETLEKLDIFSYIFISSTSPYYYKVLAKQNIFEKIIEE